MSSIRNKIKDSCSTLKLVEVSIPEWGLDKPIFIKQLTTAENLDLSKLLGDAKFPSYAVVIPYALRYEDGSKVLVDDEDAQALDDVPGRIVAMLLEAYSKLNNFTDETLKEAKKN